MDPQHTFSFVLLKFVIRETYDFTSIIICER